METLTIKTHFNDPSLTYNIKHYLTNKFQSQCGLVNRKRFKASRAWGIVASTLAIVRHEGTANSWCFRLL